MLQACGFCPNYSSLLLQLSASIDNTGTNESGCFSVKLHSQEHVATCGLLSSKLLQTFKSSIFHKITQRINLLMFPQYACFLSLAFRFLSQNHFPLFSLNSYALSHVISPPISYFINLQFTVPDFRSVPIYPFFYFQPDKYFQNTRSIMLLYTSIHLNGVPLFLWQFFSV